MKHPSLYETYPWNGVHVMEVDEGTSITDQRTGQTLKVTEDSVVFKGNLLYCTAGMAQNLRDKIPSGTSSS